MSPRINGIINNETRFKAVAKACQIDHSCHEHDAEGVIAKLSEFDPTKNKQYLNWIVDRYGEKNFFIEDGARVKAAIEIYHQVKQTLKTEEKDIGYFKTIANLEDAIEPFITKDESFMSNKEMVRQAKKGGRKFMDYENFKIIIPESHAASVYYGYGTRWCTASKDDSDTFDEYHKKGPLYIIIANSEKFQLQYESDQFTNARDEPVTEKDIAFLSSFEEYKEFLEYLIVKHYTLPSDSEAA